MSIDQLQSAIIATRELLRMHGTSLAEFRHRYDIAADVIVQGEAALLILEQGHRAALEHLTMLEGELRLLLVEANWAAPRREPAGHAGKPGSATSPNPELMEHRQSLTLSLDH